MKIGCHVSNSGDSMLVGAVQEALSYNANCFMIYHGAPQNSYRKPIADFRIPEYLNLLEENQIDPHDIIVHAPYILNLAQADEDKRAYAVDFIVREVETTAAIGAKYIVVHPGSVITLSMDEGISQIIKSLKEVLDRTKDLEVTIALETMAGKGTEACFRFEHLETIINEIKSERIKVCLDTCHTFDSGYDWVNNYEEIMDQINSTIGFENIKVIHLNDSLNISGSRKDRHANLGIGNIGFETLLKICYDERFAKLPKILETPYVANDEGKKVFPPYKQEIIMLRERKFNSNLIEDIKNGN